MTDKRDCPECGTRMNLKEELDREEFGRELWQCPKCKNIEIISMNIGKGYDQYDQ